jgi:hypothetical protein
MLDLPIIKKSSVRAVILKAKTLEYEMKELKEKHETELQTIKGMHEIQMMEKKSEIDMLNRVIDNKQNQLNASYEREIRAKEIFLKAQEIITCVDYEFRKHAENQTRSMAQFTEIRLNAEEFNRKMIEGK